jgi:microcystin degradation protein MlrC
MGEEFGISVSDFLPKKSFGPTMRVFAAGFQMETNTFSPWLTGLRGFEEGSLRRGEAALDGGGSAHMTARLWRDLCALDGHAFTPGLFAWAQPSGPIVQSTYEGLRNEILADLEANGPFDVALLFLHGAMVSTGCDDCEADLVWRAREIMGDGAVIGAELDPHCHLSQALIDAADAVVLMKHYPHDDHLERGRELYDLSIATAEGRVRPTAALFDCRMVGFYPTTREPMAGLVDRFKAAEREDGVLSVSFAHGFPWGDTPDTGSRVLVIADDDASLAAKMAKRIGMEVYNQRDLLLPGFPALEVALELVEGASGLAVIADTADNPGGGAPGDNTSLLAALLERGIQKAALAAIWDPIAVAICADAGVGARLNLRLGGKSGRASADPLDVAATVRAVKADHSQSGLGGSTSNLGLSVWLEIGDVDVVVASTRTQVFSPDAFTGLGIDLSGKRVVAVKSSQHFQGGFAPIASMMIQVATRGALQMDFAALPYVKKRDLNFHPRVADPLA